MRYTPYLDKMGIVVREEISDYVANLIDNLLEIVNSTIDWGSYKGKKRNPCKGQPLLLTGMPIGQHHCDYCGEMQIAGRPHLSPDEDYEEVMGREWPAGYEGATT